MEQMQRLVEIMNALRDPETGCPWDLEQDFESIVPHTLEEAYEVAQAIEHGDLDEVRTELGDLLFQVVFYARLAQEAGHFRFDDVAGAISDKLVRRHPHVFGEASVNSAEAQTRAWEAQKAGERAGRAERSERPPSVMDDIPLALPGLTRGVKIQRRAARVGFDWGEPRPVIAKIREELDELEAALQTGDRDGLAEELGDVLFACANLGRHMGIDPEQSLRATNAKFERRFRRMEALLRAEERAVEDVSFDSLEDAYQRAKAEEKAAPW